MATTTNNQFSVTLPMKTWAQVMVSLVCEQSRVRPDGTVHRMLGEAIDEINKRGASGAWDE